MRSELRRVIITDPDRFLTFLRERYPVFHESNVFFRDLHYAIMGMLEREHVKHTYAEAEEATAALVRDLEARGIFLRIDDRTWMVNFPAFKKPPVKPIPEPAKTAATVARPAAAQAPSGTAAPAVSR